MLYINRLQEQDNSRKLQNTGNSIIKEIIGGLDYGFVECKCYKNAVRLGYLSIEEELGKHDLHMNYESYFEIIGQVKEYFSKYEDIQIVRDSDEYGEFIEVQRIEI